MTIIHHGINPMARWILPSKQTRPRRSTVGRAGTGFRKHHAGLRQTIQIRCIDKFVSAKSRIIPAHVIGQDEDEIGRRILRENRWNYESEAQKREKEAEATKAHTGVKPDFVKYDVENAGTTAFSSVTSHLSTIRKRPRLHFDATSWFMVTIVREESNGKGCFSHERQSQRRRASASLW